MTYLDWDERMGVGKDVIDAQHRKLVALINDIAGATARGATRGELGGLVRSFCDYAQVHFRTEQSFMDSTDYADYFRQAREHEECAMQALNFYRGYINGENVAVEDFLRFVSTWFVEHTLGVDQTLRAYLEKKASRDRAGG